VRRPLRSRVLCVRRAFVAVGGHLVKSRDEERVAMLDVALGLDWI
jgi:hypothetical protein